MKSPKQVVEDLSLHWSDDVQDEDELACIVSTVKRYAENADRYSLRDSDRIHLRRELEAIIEDSAQALATLISLGP